MQGTHQQHGTLHVAVTAKHAALDAAGQYLEHMTALFTLAKDGEAAEAKAAQLAEQLIQKERESAVAAFQHDHKLQELLAQGEVLQKRLSQAEKESASAQIELIDKDQDMEEAAVTSQQKLDKARAEAAVLQQYLHAAAATSQKHHVEVKRYKDQIDHLRSIASHYTQERDSSQAEVTELRHLLNAANADSQHLQAQVGNIGGALKTSKQKRAAAEAEAEQLRSQLAGESALCIAAQHEAAAGKKALAAFHGPGMMQTNGTGAHISAAWAQQPHQAQQHLRPPAEVPSGVGGSITTGPSKQLPDQQQPQELQLANCSAKVGIRTLNTYQRE